MPHTRNSRRAAKSGSATQLERVGHKTVALPDELVDHIIQELHDSGEAVDNCLFVCRAWSRIAYLYRFRTLRFTAKVVPREYYEECGDSEHSTYPPDTRTFEDFFAYLSNASMVCECARELVLKHESLAFMEPPTPLTSSTLRAILSHLPRLKSLYIATRGFVISPHDSGVRFVPSAVHLDHLILDEPVLMTAKSIFFLFSMFHSVKSIHFMRTSFKSERYMGQKDIALPDGDKMLAFQEIRVGLLFYRDLQAWLTFFVPLVDGRALRSLSIVSPERYYDSVEPDIVPRIITTFGPTLRELLYGWFQPTSTYEPVSLDLSICANLQSLDVMVSTEAFNPEYRAMLGDHFGEGWTAALHTLANAPRSVRRVGLHIVPADVVEKLWEEDGFYSGYSISAKTFADGLAELDWSSIEAVLNNHPLLEAFVVRALYCGVPTKEDEWDAQHFEGVVQKTLTEKCFSPAERRGILQVKFEHLTHPYFEQVMAKPHS